MNNYYFFSIVTNSHKHVDIMKQTFKAILKTIFKFDKKTKILYVIDTNHIHALIKTSFKLTVKYLLNIIPPYLSFKLYKINATDKKRVANYILKHKGKINGNYRIKNI